MIPDNRPKINTITELDPKCEVLYFPINFEIQNINSIIVRNCMNDYLDCLENKNYSGNEIRCFYTIFELDLFKFRSTIAYIVATSLGAR